MHEAQARRPGRPGTKGEDHRPSPIRTDAPGSGSWYPESNLISVDFPEPFSPRSPWYLAWHEVQTNVAENRVRSKGL